MDLLSKMVAGAPHFIRCIRPNKDKIPGYFDSETVSVQLKYTGVLETTKIRRLGYSHRIAYADFVKRYSILVYPLKAVMPPTKETCADILQKLGLRNWKIGKTKLFLKYYHAEQLTRLYEEINHKIIIIQCAVRRWLARRAFTQQKLLVNRAATQIQKVYRGYRVRKLNKELKECKSKAASLLQAQIRGYLARIRYKKKTMERNKYEKHQNYDKLLRSIKTIQSHWRGYAVRKVYKELKLDRATKSMQFGYFCQQIELLGTEAFMSMIKSNYYIDLNDLNHINGSMVIDANNNYNKINLNKLVVSSSSSSNQVVNNANSAAQMGLVQTSSNILPSSVSSSANGLREASSVITNDLVNKIKKNLEQKAFMISKQQSVSTLLFFLIVNYLNELIHIVYINLII